MPSSRNSCLSRSKVRKNASSVGASAYPATLALIQAADRYRGELTRAITRFSSRSALAVATTSSLSYPRRRPVRLPARGGSRLHRLDQPSDPFVTGPERVLEQHRPLRLVVQLEVHPIDGVVPPGVLGRRDELAAQSGPGGLWRHRGRLDDPVLGDHLRRASHVEQR